MRSECSGIPGRSTQSPRTTNSIVISVNGTITLASPLPAVSHTTTITGPGADRLTVQGSATASPVFTTSGTITLSAMTIAGGSNSSGNGGGIAVTSGSLVLLNSVVTGNSAALGGAISSVGTLTIRRSTITGNMGSSAVDASGDATVLDSTIADNQGTAIVFTGAGKTLLINRSTISGNAGGSGVGGLQLQGGTANLANTTFSGNTGAQAGDFWTFSDGVALSLINVTAAGSSAPSLLFDHAATVTLRNALLAGTGARCAGTGLPTSQGHNLSTDATCNLTAAGDKPGGSPMLGLLAANGGLTKTHLPMAGSQALNAGDNAAVEPQDQRGKMRVQFGVVDIGAVEAVEPIITTQPSAQALTEGGTLTLTVVAMNQDSTAPLAFQWRKGGTEIAGATSATLTKASAAPSDAGMYDVLVINEGGRLASSPVMVTVTAATQTDGPPADAGVGGGGDDDGGGGGCCSSTDGAASSAALALALLGLLGLPRRRRAASPRD